MSVLTTQQRENVPTSSPHQRTFTPKQIYPLTIIQNVLNLEPYVNPRARLNLSLVIMPKAEPPKNLGKDV